MITIGLILELLFVSDSLRTPIEVSLKTDKIQSPIIIKINYKMLDIWYLGYHIWHENLNSSVSMFGIESVSEIAKIINLIDAGSEEWRKLVYKEKHENRN